jgi:hypothetical protein
MVVAMNEDEHPQDLELDQLLGRWAERRQVEKSLDQMHGQIMSAWLEEGAQHPDSADVPSGFRVRSRYTMRDRAVWFAIGVAAALIVAVGVSFVSDDGRSSVPEIVRLQPDEVMEKAKLLREMERMFENRLEWVAETGGRVLLEIREEDLSSGPAPTGVAVRVVVVQRGPRQPQWKPVWGVDLVARQEQVIRLTPESASLPKGTEFSLWTYTADEQMIAVDSNLSLVGLPVESTFSGLQQSGIPNVVHATERNGVQYRVYQTVAILDNNEV